MINPSTGQRGSYQGNSKEPKGLCLTLKIRDSSIHSLKLVRPDRGTEVEGWKKVATSAKDRRAGP